MRAAWAAPVGGDVGRRAGGNDLGGFINRAVFQIV